MKEQWRDVIDFEGSYEVSNLGRVRSLDRVVYHPRSGTMKLKGRVLRSPPDKDGHLIVGLHEGGVRCTRQVHQLVMATWIGPCPEGQEVCHGPKGVSDNSVGNLSYGTRGENCLDKRRDGTHGGRAVRRSDGKEFINMQIAAEETGCRFQSIWRVCKGNRKTTGGYGWEFIEDDTPRKKSKKKKKST